MIDRYVSPTELRRLLSALLVVAVFIALLAVFAFLVVPGTRNANRPVAGPGMVPGGPLLPRSGDTGWLDPTDYPAERGRTLPPVDPEADRLIASMEEEQLAAFRRVRDEIADWIAQKFMR